MSEMGEAIYNSKSALPNKLMQSDGSITDMAGTPATNAVDAYKARPALPNKFLNPDGSYSTLGEIIGSMVDTSLFIIVDELPASGDEQKIYLVPDGEGGFLEYHWIGSKWDPVGSIGNSAPSQVFYWDGSITTSTIEFWNNVRNVNKETPLIVFDQNRLVAELPVGYLNTGYDVIFWSNHANITIASSSSSKGRSRIEQSGITLRISVRDDAVTDVTVLASPTKQSHYIDAANNPSGVAFIPTQDWQPATKKYVDDAISDSITNALTVSY